MALRVFVHAARVAVNGRNGFVTRRRHLSTAAGVDTEGIELKISNPNAILNSIATQYESTRKILMEYVDNSLDSAEEILRDNPAHTPTYASTKRYPYKVCVNVDIDRRPQRYPFLESLHNLPVLFDFSSSHIYKVYNIFNNL